MEQMLSPHGAKPNESYTKRSRYDEQKFKANGYQKKSYRGAEGRAREGSQDFNMAGSQQSSLTSQRSRFESEGAREAGQSARTFASRYEDQAARTKEFSGADESYRTGDAREAGDRYYTGQKRGFASRTLGANQLSPTARETASLYPADHTAPLNEEDVRRVLNKTPRER